MISQIPDLDFVKLCPPAHNHRRATIACILQLQYSHEITARYIDGRCLTQQIWSLKLMFHADRFIGSPRSTSIPTRRPRTHQRRERCIYT